jgi:iron-sulfur cluster assembly protein
MRVSAQNARYACYKLAAGNDPLVRYHAHMATVEHPVEVGADLPGETLISLTPVAAAKIKDLLSEESDESLVLRVAIQGGGCSGFQYGLGFDTIAEGDLQLELEGVPVVVDPFSAPHLRGTTIDFLNTIQESGFKIDNPNAVSSCGCGHSFQVAEDEELPEGTHTGGCGSGCSH